MLPSSMQFSTMKSFAPASGVTTASPATAAAQQVERSFAITGRTPRRRCRSRSRWSRRRWKARRRAPTLRACIRPLPPRRALASGAGAGLDSRWGLGGCGSGVGSAGAGSYSTAALACAPLVFSTPALDRRLRVVGAEVERRRHHARRHAGRRPARRARADRQHFRQRRHPRPARPARRGHLGDGRVARVAPSRQPRVEAPEGVVGSLEQRARDRQGRRQRRSRPRGRPVGAQRRAAAGAGAQVLAHGGCLGGARFPVAERREQRPHLRRSACRPRCARAARGSARAPPPGSG